MQRQGHANAALDSQIQVSTRLTIRIITINYSRSSFPAHSICTPRATTFPTSRRWCLITRAWSTNTFQESSGGEIGLRYQNHSRRARPVFMNKTFLFRIFSLLGTLLVV